MFAREHRGGLSTEGSLMCAMKKRRDPRSDRDAGAEQGDLFGPADEEAPDGKELEPKRRRQLLPGEASLLLYAPPDWKKGKR